MSLSDKLSKFMSAGSEFAQEAGLTMGKGLSDTYDTVTGHFRTGSSWRPIAEAPENTRVLVKTVFSTTTWVVEAEKSHDRWMIAVLAGDVPGEVTHFMEVPE